MGVIASGALLLTIQKKQLEAIQNAFSATNIQLFALGRIIEQQGVFTADRQLLRRITRDGIGKLFQ